MGMKKYLIFIIFGNLFTPKPFQMQRSILLCSFLVGLFFLNPNTSLSGMAFDPDTCTTNDDCSHAIWIGGIVSDQASVCIDGCNMYSSPDTVIESCQMGDFPTVWYVIMSDPLASLINIEVYSSDIEAPMISLFKGTNGCDALEQIQISNSNMSCVIGSDGVAKAIGTPVDADEIYYIAVSSYLSIGGSFQVCVSTISNGSLCVVDRNIEVVARSNGGPIEGPYDPGETVSICMNVNSYTASGNGCQWFQGLVPVFGNGWDPASFDSNGQPILATVNDYAMGEPGNGLYGASFWDWYNNVGYHHDNPRLTIMDFDGNGTVDICNSFYESDCPDVGVLGGCCGPCWGDQGDILPPGWFARGINGSCPDTGTISVDWGDGNTCGAGMGPWHFCFDLTTREIPDCLEDSINRDLTLGYFTFADGETGSWTGSASVCALDQPVKISLKAKCGKISYLDLVILPDMCSGDSLQLLLDEPGIDWWEWNISPFNSYPYLQNIGINGTVLQEQVINTGSTPIHVTGLFIGRTEGSPDKVVRKVSFAIKDPISCGTVAVEPGAVPHDANSIRIQPVIVDQETLIRWTFTPSGPLHLQIYDTHGALVEERKIESTAEQGYTLQAGHLAPGLYIITLSDTNSRFSARMVKL